MKKLLFSFSLLAIIISSCGNSESSDSQNSFKDRWEETTTEVPEEESVNQDEQKWIRRAAIIAQSFVKSRFAKDADFDDFSYRGTESKAVRNRYCVTQSFTAKLNGRKQEFDYLIWIQYYGGEWEDKKNWDYGELTIENTSSGQEWRYDGGMKKREKITSGSSSAGGVNFSIAEASEPNFIRIATPKQLNNSEIKKVAKELGSKYESIFFCINSKKERGDEYVNVQGDLVFDYRGDGEIKNLEDL